jgi:hypothetical protein
VAPFNEKAFIRHIEESIASSVRRRKLSPIKDLVFDFVYCKLVSHAASVARKDRFATFEPMTIWAERVDAAVEEYERFLEKSHRLMMKAYRKRAGV